MPLLSLIRPMGTQEVRLINTEITCSCFEPLLLSQAPLTTIQERKDPLAHVCSSRVLLSKH